MDASVAALAGALIGGAASTLGALIVSRRSQARAYRVRIYDELLPKIMEYVPQADWPGTTKAQLRPDHFREKLDPIVRAAHVIGGKDATRVDAIYQLLVRLGSIADQATEQFDEEQGKTYLAFHELATREDYDAANRKFLEAVDAYRLWLRERLDKKI